MKKIIWLINLASIAFLSLRAQNTGSLHAWGENSLGQLGLGTVFPFQYQEPQKVGFASAWVSVATGRNYPIGINEHSIAINKNGELYAWGDNQRGQLGLDNTTPQYNTPQRVGSASNWVSIACGAGFTLAVNSLGELYSWGKNDFGQLGLGSTADEYSPQKVGVANNWVSIACGIDHVLAINSNGELFSWGRNDAGQLGLANSSNYTSPKKIGIERNWKSTSCGWKHSLAINTNGELYTWGMNNWGQLGVGNVEDKSSPQKLDSLKIWEFGACGIGNTYAINANGELYMWGFEPKGLNNIPHNRPQKVGVATNWKTVVCGTYHTFAINKSNELYGWGDNQMGQLGLGNYTLIYTTPQKVRLLPNAIVVAAGSSHTMAIALNSSTAIHQNPQNNIRLYPNPTSGAIYFNEQTRFVITDLTGNNLFSSNVSLNMLDIEFLPNGIYLVKNEFGNTQKLIVQR
jgi:alpha-tubulin suppressor-like RCC1 family protein